MIGMEGTDVRILLQVAVILLALNYSECASVASLTPTTGGTNGAILLTIKGTGFAKSQFNFGVGNSNLGNRVTLTSGTQQYDCPVHKDGTNENRIQCITPPLREGTYNLRVAVDGVDIGEISSNIQFTASHDLTPTIDSVTPRSGPPGSHVTFCGKIFTDKYGSNVDASSNGRNVSIKRVLVGNQLCDLKNVNDLYGIQLSGDDGCMTCKIGESGTKVGNINASFILTDEFGRSKPNGDFVVGKDQFYMFQTFSDIVSVNPSTGSLEGGTRITINGKNFDDIRSPPVVMVGGTPCTVKSNTNVTIICETAREPASIPTIKTGNRGLRHQTWNTAPASVSGMKDSSSVAANHSGVLDEIKYNRATTGSGKPTRLSGFFKPPIDGDYRFNLTSLSGSTAPAELHLSTDDSRTNMVKVIPSQNSDSLSGRISLSKTNDYYMEVYDINGTFAEVSVSCFNSSLTSASTNYVKAEVHRIAVSCASKPEKQNIRPQGFQTSTATHAVQEIVVEQTTAEPGGQFRLSLYSASTDFIRYKASSEDVAATINDHAIFEGASAVTVTEEPTDGDGIKYTVTFNLDWGDFPVFGVEDAGSLSVRVTKTIEGVTSGGFLSLGFSGVKAPPVAVNAPASEVQASLKKLSGTQCPGKLTSPARKIHHYTFEEANSTPLFLLYKRYKGTQAFCGHYVAKNPSVLFQTDDRTPLSTTRSPIACFAHQGPIGSDLIVKFQYTSSEGQVNKEWRRLVGVITPTGAEWDYSCVNLHTELQNKVSGGSLFSLFKLVIERSGDIFVDEVYMGSEEPTTDPNVTLQRIQGPKLNGGHLIDNIVVEKSSTSYDVTLFPQDCGDNFPLLTSEQEPAGASVTVTRLQTASPKLGGTFDLTFLGSKLRIPINITADGLAGELSSIQGVDNVSVVYNGICSDYTWTISYNSLAGDQPLIKLDSALVTGADVSMTANTVVDGSVLWSPIPGDLLRVPAEKTQVTLITNDVPARCLGNCDFEWLASSTPTVTAISPGTGQSGSSTTITGTGFSVLPTDNSVLIGGTPCDVTSSTSTSISCTVGNVPAGTHKVNINVAGSGLAQHTGGDISFVADASISSFAPGSCALGGGMNLTLNGNGFRDDAVVTVGGQPCPVLSSSPAQLICVIPPTTSAGSVAVALSIPGVSAVTATSSFVYDATITGQISSISQTTSSVKGGDVLTITGSGFGSSGTLMVGNTVVSPVTYTDSLVSGPLPSLGPGVYPVKVLKQGAGAAVMASTNAVPEMGYILKVKRVFPRWGSLYGGTKVTVTGEGLDPAADITIGGHCCTVDAATATSTEVVCTVCYTGQTHYVSNNGSDPVFGSGYSWQPKNLNLNVGDMVRWTWELPQFVQSRLMVVQVPNTTSLDAVPAGFSSNIALHSGSYEYQFNSQGRRHYCSGPLNSQTNDTLRGSVSVAPLASYAGDVTVQLAGKEAEYDLNSGLSDPTEPCQGSPCVISGCSDPAPSGGDPNKFNFQFWSCLTPNVTAISPNRGTTEDDITISGTGFSSVKSQNKVTFGGAACVVSESSPTQLKCKLDPVTSPSVDEELLPDVRVDHRGSALPYLERKHRTFTLVPVISSFSPILGSLEGNTALTISGSGFQGSSLDVDVTVRIGDQPCPVTTFSYTSIVCSTPKSSSDGAMSLEVKVRAGDQMIHAVCAPASCDFNYDLSSTASVSSVSPTTVNGSPQPLTITGQRLTSSIDDVTVTVGGETCAVTSATVTSVECTIGAVPVGDQPLVVDIAGRGRAISSSSLTVTSQAVISSVSPSAGSANGGTDVTITGNGFVPGSTVTIDGTNCPVASVSLARIVCKTAPHVVGNNLDLVVTSSGTNYVTDKKFSYTNEATPVISALSPTSGSSGDTVTISGTYFGANSGDNIVTLGGRECTVTSSSTTEIACTVGDYRAGSYKMRVDVTNKGLSNDDKMFTFDMMAASIAPNAGSRNGGQTVTISGSGFDDTTAVTIDSSPCVQSTKLVSTATQFFCVTPAADSGTTTCSVEVTTNLITRTLSYTYDSADATQVTGVTPTVGGTGGGTTITITGSGFGNTVADCAVSINGSECTVTSVSDSEIVCETGPISKSVKDKVRVEIAGGGTASWNGPEEFHYVDFWSSKYTWGGGSLPGDGDFVVIQPGQTLFLDTTTAVLKLLLVQGEFIASDKQDMELHAENILVTSGGLFQVGTEDNPFQHNLNIILHGHVRSKELPLYGTKGIAVRDGILDIHGKPISVPWTLLGETANAGTDQISLQQSVDWKVGDEIVIATTGDGNSQRETETNFIKDISADRRVLTLTSNLEYTHLGVTLTQDIHKIELRAEVGLLTRNVKILGSTNEEWLEEIEACPDGFDVGEFATQTCFQGRFGDEVGSDEFGSHILVHRSGLDATIYGRISYAEISNAGQAFRLGRYPVHFHLLGEALGSYVRGVSIHNTFNRAINIHGTHNVLLEHNIVYKVMGGAIFLEDGIEHDNIIQYNLALFVRESTSLLNDDITPAGFWLTSPDNTVRHNHGAGGTHFGFWYAMHEHPVGPSYDENICPRNKPVGVFTNNTAHSQGWFGLWTFPVYTPKEGGGCDTKIPKPAIFEKLTAWHCEKGAEWVDSGSLQFIEANLYENEEAGVEIKQLIEPAGSSLYDGPLIKDSVVWSHASGNYESNGTKTGIRLPYGGDLLIDNVTFINFDSNKTCAFSWAKIDGTCTKNCVAPTYKTSRLKWINSSRRVCYGWDFQGVLEDLDGTISDSSSPHSRIITANSNFPSSCVDYPYGNTAIPARLCPADVKPLRFGFNNLEPKSLWYKDFIIANENGEARTVFLDKRITNKNGWVIPLLSGSKNYARFEGFQENLNNFSFTGQVEGLQESDFARLVFKVNHKPDRLQLNAQTGFIDGADGPLDPNAGSGWHYDSATKELDIIISGKDLTSESRRKKRASASVTFDKNTSFALDFKAYKCFYFNCTPPPDPSKTAPLAARPDWAVMWSSSDSWGFRDNTKPTEGDDLNIPQEVWMVADTAIPWLGQVILYGTLEFDHGTTAPYRNIDLNATHIIIIGGRLIIGWPDEPYLGNAQVILRGNNTSPIYEGLPNAPFIGAKAMAVFGVLDLHGIDIPLRWTRLSRTAFAGERTLSLSSSVGWTAGSEVVLAPSSYEPLETEVFRIDSVSSDGLRLTLNSSLQYNHAVLPKDDLYPELGAEVALLTRNVKVIGEIYDSLYRDYYGGRVIIGVAQNGSQQYKGCARISNTEFFQMGQQGFIDLYDPRFAISYLDTGTVDNIRPSYLHRNTFHNCFSPGIGIFGANNFGVKENILHHTVTAGIWSTGTDIRIEGNVVILTRSEATILDRFETSNLRLSAAIQIENAVNPWVGWNIVAGSQRTGLWLDEKDCNSDGHPPNIVHSSIIGVAVYPQIPSSATCLLLSNITAWKNMVGLYYQNTASLEVRSVVSVENRYGATPFVMGPTALNHETAEKSVTFKHTTLVGATSSYNCSSDAWKSSTLIRQHPQIIPPIRDGSNKGIMMSVFSSASNGMSKFPYYGTMSYNSNKGVTNLRDVTFANFGEICGRKNHAVTSNPEGDDMQHPLFTRNVIWKNTHEHNKLYLYRPRLSKINGADCIDMDCDGMKKNILCDEDGTFFGKKGCAVSESEWEWDGDPQRGLGDYRIPKSILSGTDGSRRPINEIAPNKGIIRSSTTEYKPEWQAYFSPDLDYRILVIESMDVDTETRRVSPVALLGDGYIDLINGPQDHGWCNGYTCRKRLSTFMAAVATGKEFKIAFTGTTPQHLRLYLINCNQTDAVRVGIWYSQPFDIDVKVDGTSKQPTNARNENGNYFLDTPSANNPDEFFPAVSDPAGQNYFDKITNNLFVTLRGQATIDLETRLSIILSCDIPPITEDELFGANAAEYLALFLGIPPEKVRRVNVVSESSNRRRRKRSTTVDVLALEISDDPSSNSSSSPLSREDLDNIADKLTNEIQLGNLSQVLNMTVNGVSMAGPPPVPGTPEWNSTTPEDSAYTTISEVAGMQFNPAAEPQYEGVVFMTQPKIQVLDPQGRPITKLGTSSQPWQITASLRPGGSNPLATLTGNLTVQFVNGWANFTDLLITQMGTDFLIDFNLTVPTDSNFSITSAPLTVAARPIKAAVTSMTSNVIENNYFALGVELRDNVTSERIQDIAWRGLTWSMTAELNMPELHLGSMLGSAETLFSTSSSKANFYTLNFTAVGMYALKLHIFTTPASYDFYEEVQVVVKSTSQTNIVVEQTSLLEMIFDADFDTVVGANTKPFATMMANRFIQKYPNVLFNSVSVEPGSIVVKFSISGGMSNLNATVYDMCESVQKDSSYTFNSMMLTLSGHLAVDGVSYYGVHCGPIASATTTSPEPDHNKSLALIVSIVVISVAVVAILMAFLIWKCKVAPKTKTRDLRGYTGYCNEPKAIEDILFREQSFMSIREKSAVMPQAPAATSIHSIGYNYNSEKSPLPF